MQVAGFWNPFVTGVQIIGTTAEQAAYVAPIEGQQWYDSTLENIDWYTGSAWTKGVPLGASTVWTPGLDQAGARATSAAVGRYSIIGNRCFVDFAVTCNAAGSAGSAILITGIPAALQFFVTGLSGGNKAQGSAVILDTGNTLYSVATCFASASTFAFQGYNTNAFMGQNVSFALAAGDHIEGNASWFLR